MIPPTGLALALPGDQSQASCRDHSRTTVSAEDEQSLIRLAQAGDRAAFEALVHRYDRDVLRLALNVLRRPEDARDVYQEAFLKVYKNLHRFRFECSFYTWVYRIVTNVCLDHMRRRHSRPEDQAPEVVPGGEAGSTDFFCRQRENRGTADAVLRLMGKEIDPPLTHAPHERCPRWLPER